MITLCDVESRQEKERQEQMIPNQAGDSCNSSSDSIVGLGQEQWWEHDGEKGMDQKTIQVVQVEGLVDGLDTKTRKRKMTQMTLGILPAKFAG